MSAVFSDRVLLLGCRYFNFRFPDSVYSGVACLNIFVTIMYAIGFMPLPFQILVGVAFSLFVIFIAFKVIKLVLDAIPFV